MNNSRPQRRRPSRRTRYTADDTDDDEDYEPVKEKPLEIIVISDDESESGHSPPPVIASSSSSAPTTSSATIHTNQSQLEQDEILARRLAESMEKDYKLALELCHEDEQRFTLNNSGYDSFEDDIELLQHQTRSPRTRSTRASGSTSRNSRGTNSIRSNLQSSSNSNAVNDLDAELARQLQMEESESTSTFQSPPRATRARRLTEELLLRMIAQQEEDDMFGDVPFAATRSVLNSRRTPRLSTQIPPPSLRLDFEDFNYRPLNPFGGGLMNGGFFNNEAESYEELLALSERIGPAKSLGATADEIRQIPIVKFDGKGGKSCG
ncbi:hypothetical protein HK098_005689 [Nowakowskiella sp. JEL0407]|nr:hypothetical protein HK098_005689 [Nowakowskiella sp. JEL0407]